jgi:hypothetical protein
MPSPTQNKSTRPRRARSIIEAQSRIGGLFDRCDSRIWPRCCVPVCLKKHLHVAGIEEAPQNEGGQGATLVELRQ